MGSSGTSSSPEVKSRQSDTKAVHTKLLPEGTVLHIDTYL